MGKYVSSQGDMWDMIALRVYGNEKLMHILIEANPQFQNIVVFPANCELNIPEVSIEENVISPKWKRTG